jgi:hypothetical protein
MASTGGMLMGKFCGLIKCASHVLKFAYQLTEDDSHRVEEEIKNNHIMISGGERINLICNRSSKLRAARHFITEVFL